MNTFSIRFVDFVAGLVLYKTFSDFYAIWDPIWHHVSEKIVREIASKKEAPLFENEELLTCPVAPRDAALRAHFSNKKQQLELELLFEFVSMALVPKN